MTKGWHGNRMGHSLASRGIKSTFNQSFDFDNEVDLETMIEHAKNGKFEKLELVINRGRQRPYIRWYFPDGGSMNTRFQQTATNEDAEIVLLNLRGYLYDNNLGHLISYIDVKGDY